MSHPPGKPLVSWRCYILHIGCPWSDRREESCAPLLPALVPLHALNLPIHGCACKALG